MIFVVVIIFYYFNFYYYILILLLLFLLLPGIRILLSTRARSFFVNGSISLLARDILTFDKLTNAARRTKICKPPIGFEWSLPAYILCHSVPEFCMVGSYRPHQAQHEKGICLCPLANECMYHIYDYVHGYTWRVVLSGCTCSLSCWCVDGFCIWIHIFSGRYVSNNNKCASRSLLCTGVYDYLCVRLNGPFHALLFARISIFHVEFEAVLLYQQPSLRACICMVVFFTANCIFQLHQLHVQRYFAFWKLHFFISCLLGGKLHAHKLVLWLYKH